MAKYYTRVRLLLEKKVVGKRVVRDVFNTLDDMRSTYRLGAKYSQVCPKYMNYKELYAEVNMDGFGFNYNMAGEDLLIYDDDGGVNLDLLIKVLSQVLTHHKSKAVVHFQWSYDSSEPGVDAYGGGAAVISSEDVLVMDTNEWVERHVFKLKRKLKGGKKT